VRARANMTNQAREVRREEDSVIGIPFRKALFIPL
jgi:hypothetical protein